MTDIEGFLTIYGHSDNLLNNKGNVSLNLGFSADFLLDFIITCILRLRWIWEGTSWPVKLSVVLLFPRYRKSIRCSIREINLIYNYNCIFPLFMVNEQLGLNIILFAEKLSLHIQLFSTVKCKPKRRLIVTFFWGGGVFIRARLL